MPLIGLTCIFCLCCVQGLTEEQAAGKGAPFEVYSHTYSPLKAHMAARATPGKPVQQCFIKLLTEPGGGKLLGLHMVGEDAPEIIQVNRQLVCLLWKHIPVTGMYMRTPCVYCTSSMGCGYQWC